MTDLPAKEGRPSKYKPEYCKALIEHMAQGFSFESFGAIAEVCPATLYNWTKKDQNPHWAEFLEAKKLGEVKARLFWERLGVNAVLGVAEGFNATVWVFSMKNKFGWKDRVENSGTITVKPYIIERRDGSQVELGHSETELIEGEDEDGSGH